MDSLETNTFHKLKNWRLLLANSVEEKYLRIFFTAKTCLKGIKNNAPQSKECVTESNLNL